MVFRFLHVADLHLETRFGGREAARERLRRATREAFTRAVDFAIERELDAFLVAGDAFDEPLLSRRTELFFAGELKRLAEAGVHVLYACGNHDPGRAGGRAAALGVEGDGDGGSRLARVHVFRGARVQQVKVAGRGGRPVAVVCGVGHADEGVTRNLAAGFRRLKTDLPVVGVLHTQVDSAQRADEHGRYAPCSRDDLAAVDYDYWALGHVHARQQPFPDVPAWYPGNLQGRHARETGPKGGLLVELGAGEPARPAFVPFAPVRWEKLPVAGLEHESVTALVDALAARIEECRAAGPEELAVVLELSGPCPLAPLLRDPHQRGELEEELLDRTGALDVELRAAVHRPRDVSDLRRTPSVLQRALELLERAAEDPRELARVAPEVIAGLPGDADLVARAEYLAALLEGLEEELLERALEEGAPQ